MFTNLTSMGGLVQSTLNVTGREGLCPPPEPFLTLGALFSTIVHMRDSLVRNSGEGTGLKEQSWTKSAVIANISVAIFPMWF